MGLKKITKKNIESRDEGVSPKQTENGDSDGERDDRQCVPDCVHGLHVGEIHMRV